MNPFRSRSSRASNPFRAAASQSLSRMGGTSPWFRAPNPFPVTQHIREAVVVRGSPVAHEATHVASGHNPAPQLRMGQRYGGSMGIPGSFAARCGPGQTMINGRCVYTFHPPFFLRSSGCKVVCEPGHQGPCYTHCE